MCWLVGSAHAATVTFLGINPHTGVNTGAVSFDTGTCVGSTIGYSYTANFTTDDGGGFDWIYIRVIDPFGNLVSARNINAAGGLASTGDFIQATAAARPFTMQVLDVTFNGGTVGPIIATLQFEPVADAGLASCASLPLVGDDPAALQSMFDSVTPGLLDSLPVNGSNGNGNGTGVTFAPTGLGLSRDGIDPLARAYGSGLGPNGYFTAGRKRHAGNGFNFSVDMNALARGAANDNPNHSSSPPDLTRGSMLTSSTRLGQPGGSMDYRVKPGNDEGEALGYGAGSSKDGAPAPQSRITSFIKGEYVDFDDGETNADRDGHLWVVTSGLGYRVSERTTIGLLSRYRTGEADSNALNATLDSDFWGGGAFLTTTIGGGLNLSVAGLYESGDNDIRIGAATGSFDSEHVTLEGRLAKRLERGTWWFEPGVAIRYVDTDQENYTDSAGTFVTNQDVTLGRLTYGPRIGTTLYRGNATLKPFARVGGVWDFKNDGSFATSTAGTYTSADHGLNLGGGVEVTYLSGFLLRLQGNWTTYDTDLEMWSISGGIGSPLSALGLGQVGFVSLDLAANADDASAQARLRIPLGTAE